MTARKSSYVHAIPRDEGEPRLAPCPSRRRHDLDWYRAEARCDLSCSYVHHRPVPLIATGSGLAITDTSTAPDLE